MWIFPKKKKKNRKDKYKTKSPEKKSVQYSNREKEIILEGPKMPNMTDIIKGVDSGSTEFTFTSSIITTSSKQGSNAKDIANWTMIATRDDHKIELPFISTI